MSSRYIFMLFIVMVVFLSPLQLSYAAFPLTSEQQVAPCVHRQQYVSASIPKKESNKKASTASVVCSVLSLVFGIMAIGALVLLLVFAAFWETLLLAASASVMAIILGVTGRKKSDNGLARAGITMGVVCLSLIILAALALLMKGFAF